MPAWVSLVSWRAGGGVAALFMVLSRHVPEAGLPAAAVVEADVEVLAVEPEQGDGGQHPAGEARVLVGPVRPVRPRPALADPVAEAQPAAVAHRQHRLGE